ncbi:MAG: transposase [Bacteroidetes bacterium]|nr:transposase [Bacteroidota bacterium]
MYSLHEPHIYCIAKGKAHVKYEFGVKASIAVTKDSGIIVGALTFEKNVNDVNTPATANKKEIENTKAKFRRRSAIEPIIGHLKFDNRMIRNHLKGIHGDFINCMLAAAGFNLKKMLQKIASSFSHWLDLCLRIYYTIFLNFVRSPAF